MIRLNKFLSQAGIASRRKCDEYIASGLVKVNDKVETRLGCLVDETKDIVTFENKRATFQKHVYLKMNKPKGYICSANDEHNRKTVYMLLPKTNERLFSIGRLDYDTEGLLLFTNDGDLAQKLAHPRNEIKKIYMAKIQGKISESELATLRKGSVFNGEKLPSANVKIIEEKKDYVKLQITIIEGKNHQIKNMFEGLGKKLLFLKRTQIANIKLGGLSRGEVRQLSDFELESLMGI